MILSRSADYALRAMIYLARNRGSRYVTLNQIATEMQTPPFLLGRIMQRLVKGDLVLSMKGHHGGFRLVRNPVDIAVADIVHQVDGPFQMFDCTGISACAMAGECTLLDMFLRAEKALDDVLRSVTLSELASHPRQGERGLPSNRIQLSLGNGGGGRSTC
jgi:Rrf2 family protein